MEHSSDTSKESDLKLKIGKLLGKEITEFSLQGKGYCNNAYLVRTSDGAKYIVKEARSDKAFHPQNDLQAEAKVAQQLYSLGLSVPTPHVVFVSEHPKMYGYEYIEGEMLMDLWGALSEDERIQICTALGYFHAEIGKKFTKGMAEATGIKINDSAGLHPEVAEEYEKVFASADVPEEFKDLAKQAKLIFDTTTGDTVFQFIHNDSHHENILIKDRRIAGIIDFGEAEYGEVAKEFSRYIRDFPEHFQYIVSTYEEGSGNKLSRKRLVSTAFLSGLPDIIEDYRKGGQDCVNAEASVATYRKLISALDLI
ncbi:MAG: aminoglycoside phosphotransferase family protein [Patescibacteria group bacterium]